MSSKEPNFFERALYLVNPQKGTEAYTRRMKKENQNIEDGNNRQGSTPKMSYGSHGASQTLNSMVGWIIDAGNAEDNIDL